MHVYVHEYEMYVCTYNDIHPSSKYLTDRCVHLLHAALQSPIDMAGSLKTAYVDLYFYRVHLLSDNRRHFQPLLYCACGHSFKFRNFQKQNARL